MEANTLLIRKVHMNCPLCDRAHEVEERKRVTSILLKGEKVTYFFRLRLTQKNQAIMNVGFKKQHVLLMMT